MKRRDVRVRPEPRTEIDIERFARALLALAAMLQNGSATNHPEASSATAEHEAEEATV